MNNKFYWAFMMQLSEHHIADHTSPAPMYLPKPYTEENNIDLRIWDQTINYLGESKFNLVLIDVCDGMKYESHPEISAPDAWDKDFLKKKLDEMRALGMTPIPKLNFSAGHDSWLKKYSRMISTPEYYAVCADLIKEVCEVFGSPELFHLGFDEEDFTNQQSYEMVTIRGEELWFHDLNYMAGECARYGARPWIWSDYVWDHEETFLKRMSKDIMQSNWYYNPFQESFAENTPYPFKKWIDAYELLDKHGFDQIPTCSNWCYNNNIRQTIAHCKHKLNSDNLKGIMVAPWMRPRPINGYALLCNAERFYLARQELYPETL